MRKARAESQTTRLEARIPVQVYDQMQRAAHLRGMILTGYLIATAARTPGASSRMLRSCVSHARIKSVSPRR